MKCLSGRQPWWWAILEAGKRIENRVWNTSYRGPILLHAAKGCTVDEYEDALVWMENRGLIDHVRDAPPLKAMQRGGIVGRARIAAVLPPHPVRLQPRDLRSPRGRHSVAHAGAVWLRPGRRRAAPLHPDEGRARTFRGIGAD
jgi:hypothetical protein